MLSKGSIMAIFVVIRLNYLIKSCPYKLNDKTLELSMCRKKSTMLLFRISTFLSVLHTVMITIRILLKLDSSDPTSISQFMLESIFIVQGVILVVFQFNTCFRTSEASNLISSMLIMDKRLSGTQYYTNLLIMIQHML